MLVFAYVLVLQKTELLFYSFCRDNKDFYIFNVPKPLE